MKKLFAKPTSRTGRASQVQRAKLTTQSKSGFTVVELMLTMGFVAVLLITIAIITSNIVTIYQKGTTLKAVNSVGRSLIDEISTAINDSPSVDTTSLCTSLANHDSTSIVRCKNNHAFDFIYHAQYSDADTNGNRVQLNGIFCTGRYSYLWNTYYGIDRGKTISAKYLNSSSVAETTSSNTRLIRFDDRNYRLCSAVMNSDYTSQYNNYNSTNPIDITSLSNTETIANPVETYDGMLKEFDLDLMLYELVIFPLSQDSVTLRSYFSGTFILATTRGSIDITRSGDYCDLGNYGAVGGVSNNSSSIRNLGAEFNYCAINKFNFAARTAGV